MTDAADIDDVSVEGDADEGARSKKPLLIAIALCAALGGGGFFAAYSGAVSLPFLGGKPPDEAEDTSKPEPIALGVAYVPLDEMVIPLSPKARARLLLFKAEIEVNESDVAGFEAIKPRLTDMFNTYLRAIEEGDLEDPSATLRLRAQLLRRVRVVASPLEPRDVLITAFVLK